MKQVMNAMKLSCLIFSLTSISFQLCAQDKHLTSPDPQQLAFVDMNENKGTFFLSAERMNTNKSNTANKNLYRNSWLPGVVQFKSGKQRHLLRRNKIDR